MGFEYFYGFTGGETDPWTPFLFRDHTEIFRCKANLRILKGTGGGCEVRRSRPISPAHSFEELNLCR
jgi:hypothetical protein